jgi:hypothetical protein
MRLIHFSTHGSIKRTIIGLAMLGHLTVGAIVALPAVHADTGPIAPTVPNMSVGPDQSNADTSMYSYLGDPVAGADVAPVSGDPSNTYFDPNVSFDPGVSPVNGDSGAYAMSSQDTSTDVGGLSGDTGFSDLGNTPNSSVDASPSSANTDPGTSSADSAAADYGALTGESGYSGVGSDPNSSVDPGQSDPGSGGFTGESGYSGVDSGSAMSGGGSAADNSAGDHVPGTIYGS